MPPKIEPPITSSQLVMFLDNIPKMFLKLKPAAILSFTAILACTTGKNSAKKIEYAIKNITSTAIANPASTLLRSC